jgi:methylmalonyl-CoA/ethylmalonyl-CoA epimerase
MLLPLHHIGYLVAALPEDAAAWVDRFGYVVSSPVIEDATQTARVQFLRQPGAPYWLELVAPLGPQSKLARALEHGPHLHHLCYEAAELEAACRHLRARGLFPLGRPVPAAAFGGRPIAWFLDRAGLLVELVAAGAGPLSLATLTPGPLGDATTDAAGP